MLGNIELCELGESQETHGQVIPKDSMHPIQMSSGGGELAFFLFLLFVPAINRDLASGLERFLLQFRALTIYLALMKPNSPLEQKRNF